MNSTAAIRVFVAAAAALCVAAASPQPARAKRKSVLFFTKSSAYEHAVIKADGVTPPLAGTILTALGQRNGFDVTHTKDGAIFTADGLAKYDALVFFTSGDLTQPGRDGNPPFPAGGKSALLDAIKKGKGFVGVHSASETFPSSPDHFAVGGDDTDPYIAMLGGELIAHGGLRTAKAICADAKFPGFAPAKGGVELNDEWYSLKNIARDVHVLLWLPTWTLPNTGAGSVYRRAPYPVAWTRLHGKGRVFYTALGHGEDVWTSPLFQSMLVGGIKWAAGEGSPGVSPNVTTVTPGHAEMPPKNPK